MQLFATDCFSRRVSAISSLSVAVFTVFHPSIGGIEKLTELLASEWTAAGHRITIITNVKRDTDEVKEFPYPVLYRPAASDKLQVVRHADVIVHNNISLKATWPLLFKRRNFIAVHHSTYFPLVGRQPLIEKAKVTFARTFANNISVSHAIKKRIGCKGVVIPNCYDSFNFYDHNCRRFKDLVFVGRLVSDKGVRVLIEALHILKAAGTKLCLTIVGNGPERANIEKQVYQLGLDKQVEFAGRQSSRDISQILNVHHVLVVPSLWDEPFGIVALEGAACGCAVVGSQGGGLPEAIGPCGETFRNGDCRGLASLLHEILSDATRLQKYRQSAMEHLAQHRPEVIAAKYIEYFRSVLSSGR